MAVRLCILLLSLFVTFRPLRACNGYNFKLNSVKNCYDKSIIQVNPGFDVIIDNDCNLRVVGCVNITKPIKSAKGTYSFKKPPLPPLEGEVDFCDSLAEYDIPPLHDTIASFGLSDKCPYPAKKACALPNKKIDLSAFKHQMALVSGTSEIKFDVEHDSGRTCTESKFTFSKARKG